VVLLRAMMSGRFRHLSARFIRLTQWSSREWGVGRGVGGGGKVGRWSGFASGLWR
jgi:hypothetical protein